VAGVLRLPASPPLPPRFPYTTLFRSSDADDPPPLPPSASLRRASVSSRSSFRLSSTSASTRETTSAGATFRTAAACLSRFSCSRSEEHTSELQSREHLVCRLLLEKKK